MSTGISSNSFSQRLLAAAGPVWQAILDHPFLAATADGSIAEQTFKTWIAQDYLFVQEEVSFLGMLLAKAPSAWRAPLADGLADLNRELALFRQQAEAHGVVLEGVEMAPTCHAYTQFLLATACYRSFAESFTVLYGVEKAYLDSWTWVKNHQQQPSPWQVFIDNWTSQAFQDYVSWLASGLDELAGNCSENELAAMEQLFLLTARYEYLFWDMALSAETWPV